VLASERPWVRSPAPEKKRKEKKKKEEERKKESRYPGNTSKQTSMKMSQHTETRQSSWE